MTAQRHSARIDAALAAVRRVGISHGARIDALTIRKAPRRPGRTWKYNFVLVETWAQCHRAMFGKWPTIAETMREFGMESWNAQRYLAAIRAEDARRP